MTISPSENVYKMSSSSENTKNSMLQQGVIQRLPLQFFPPFSYSIRMRMYSAYLEKPLMLLLLLGSNNVTSQMEIKSHIYHFPFRWAEEEDRGNKDSPGSYCHVQVSGIP